MIIVMSISLKAPTSLFPGAHALSHRIVLISCSCCASVQCVLRDDSTFPHQDFIWENASASAQHHLQLLVLRFYVVLFHS